MSIVETDSVPANFLGLNRTCKVGSYEANVLGLHDMHGNVWEWCEDTYAPYAEGDAVDPLVWNPKVGLHAVRGGGWNRSVRGIQAAFRGAAIMSYEVPALGFRCVRNPS
jgi:formylglycine-generating enzyme required for sulfatase activity